MRNRCFRSLAIPLAGLLIGCSSCTPAAQGNRPEDFAVEYRCSETARPEGAVGSIERQT